MKRTKFVAGLLSAALLMSAPGAIQTALAADSTLTVAGTVQTVSNPDTKSYQVKVTADMLNIRKKADKDSDITGVLKKGDKVTITSESTDSRGVKWGKLESGKGWINLSFTQKTDGSSFSSYKVKVTADSLNIRSKADKSSEIKGVLKKGDIVTIVAEQKDSRGVKWGKLESGKGWISLSYAQKTDDSSVSSYKVKVTAENLNIRSKADKSSAVKGVLKKDDIVTIVAEQKDSRGVTWGKLENGQGWISLKYAQKTEDTPAFSKYKVKVTAESLNIRSKAGTSGAINGVLKKGAVVTIVAEQKDGNGTTWGKLDSGKGWISLKYTQKTTADAAVVTSYQVKVTADTLNIRKKPDKSSEVVGYLKKGNVFTIVDESTDSRGVTWGKLKNGDGWINLNYTKKV
ncbi:MAG: SH3 domain-containing protein [Candidatus Onthomonas sp.]